MTHSDRTQLIFPLAPKPYPDESMTSWLIRLCGTHQYPFHYIEKLTGIRPKRHDWDCGLTKDQTDHLLAAAGLDRAAFFPGKLDPWFLEECGVKLHPWQRNGKPAYLWCDACLMTDKEPYLRWQWRYQDLIKCTVHDQHLRPRCTYCDKHLFAHRSLLLQVLSGPLMLDLASCQHCGQSIADPVTAEMSRKFNKVAQNLSMRNVRYRLMDISWFEIANSVETPRFVYAPRTVGSKWSRRLLFDKRRRVAEALSLIRKELHAYRREARATKQVQAQIEAQRTRP